MDKSSTVAMGSTSNFHRAEISLMRVTICSFSSKAGVSGKNKAMFSQTFNAGIRRISWNTKPIPSCLATDGDEMSTVLPSTDILPESGWYTP
ncbi:hypothetical protein BBOU_0195 [Bifidobacterium boum]|uniref:Uncharacterized protein n=1 Tax=Bifidobacterium boum TaxID=78343 RepID=A0A086ZRE5_9BIFI|nr:hypothetical protein BBOU_0195 [Bifidobacterium boum]